MNTETTENKITTNDTKTPSRCHTCRKKLKMIHFTCKCNHRFCIIHLNPHSHDCQYDYKKEKEELIIKNNPLCHTKMTKI